MHHRPRSQSAIECRQRDDIWQDIPENLTMQTISHKPSSQARRERSASLRLDGNRETSFGVAIIGCVSRFVPEVTTTPEPTVLQTSTPCIIEEANALGLRIYVMLLTSLGIILALANTLKEVPLIKELNDFFSILILCFSNGLLIFLLVETTLYRRDLHRRMSVRDKPTAIPESEEGLNFLLRIGVIFFSMAAIILDIWTVVNESYANGNPSPLRISAECLEMIFYMLQSYFLFKYHRIVFHRRLRIIRFILVHLIAVNIISWFSTATVEAAHVFNSGKADHKLKPSQIPPNATDKFQDESSDVMTDAKLYLYPFIIEYSVLSAGALFNIYRRIDIKPKSTTMETANGTGASEDGKIDRPGLNPDLMTIGRRQHMCQKSHTGLFLGILVASAYLVYIVFHFIRYPKKYSHKTLTVFQPIKLTISGLGLVIVIVLSIRMMRHLTFKPHLHLFVDRFLMHISFCANVFFSLLLLLADFHQITGRVEKRHSRGLLDTFNILDTVFMALQCFAQTSFILIGVSLRDHSGTGNKPGNTLLIILLALNLMMWIDESLFLKKEFTTENYTSFFGKTTWYLLVSIFKPLVVFYRFHSATMLAEMWTNVYRSD